MVSLGTLPAERGVSQSAITNNPRKVLQPAIQQSSTSATIVPPLSGSLVSSKKGTRKKKTSAAAAAYFEHSDRGSSGEMKQEYNRRIGRPNLTIKPGGDSRFDSNSHGRSAAESATEELPDGRVINKAYM